MLQVVDAELLIAFITRPAVNVRAISNGFLLVSLVSTRVLLKKYVCPAIKY